jgi:N-acetylneuraminic acid mutarotase/DNA-binding beta-propeller fold protein YncE
MPRGVTVDSLGRFVFVTDTVPSQVEAFQIDQTGALVPQGSTPAGNQPIGVTVDPAGQFAYVANNVSGDLSTFSVDQNNGVLTPLGSVPAGGPGPYAVVVDPSNQYVYVVNQGGGVYPYTLTSGLPSQNGPPVNAGVDARSLVVSPLFPFVYAQDGFRGDLWSYFIQGDGSLMTIGSVQAAVHGTSVGVDTINGRFLWASDNPKIAPFYTNPDGSLTSAGPSIPVPAGVEQLTTSTGPTSNWDSGSPTNTSRSELAAVTGPDGRIYAMGGRFVCGTDGTIQAYDTVADTWTTVGARGFVNTALAAAAGADRRIYTFGGYVDCDVDQVRSDVQAYDTSLNAWSALTSMPTPRAGLAAAAAPNGLIYLIGGFPAGPQPALSVVEAYDPAIDTWFTVKDLPVGRALHAAVTAPDGRIYVMGGLDPTGLITPSVVAYDPSTDTWSDVAPIPTPRLRLAATLGQDGKIYTVGGNLAGNFPVNNVEVYDPVTNAWTTREVMPTARTGLAAATGLDGRIYAIDGASGPDFLTTVEVFAPPQQ